MSKRRALTQLTRDDLDRDESPEREETEYAGSGVASAEVLSQRKIITARRSLPSASSPKASPFAAINLTSTGKASSSSSTSSSSAFSSAVLTSSPASVPAFGSAMKYQPVIPSPLTRSDPPVSNGTRELVVWDRDGVFYEKMRSLNHSFQQHMASHLQKDPETDYSQNCQEYINYIAKLQKDYPITERDSKQKQKEATAAAGLTSAPTTTAQSPAAGGADVTPTPSATTKSANDPAASPFVLPAPVSNSKFPALSFGQKVPAIGSVFMPPAGPSSSLGAAPVTSVKEQIKEQTGDEDEYVPPKNEEINVDEEDSIFSKRIKLYYLKEKKYEVMGKGMLHVKSLPGSKYQLLVRGENAIGTIWLNVLLVDGIPMKLMKKDVQVVCMTKSPAKPNDSSLTSVTYLLRCASEADASDLLSNLSKYAGATDDK